MKALKFFGTCLLAAPLLLSAGCAPMLAHACHYRQQSYVGKLLEISDSGYLFRLYGAGTELPDPLRLSHEVVFKAAPQWQAVENRQYRLSFSLLEQGSCAAYRLEAISPPRLMQDGGSGP
ncbi:hypothetical protein LZP73_13815 [Shewanella sp. AS16]|uniref:hypothetical protein n=1 Tax=Shewanella sp. AS16 TaxID=2907625 RepID=UPI001F3466CB|nr:hypothetical protein [Shewanella sp. AS16]MCE9687269.1 hypothetical protein [Shewanella sp. AS16]